MRILKLKPREAFWVGPAGANPETPVGEVFGERLIEVMVTSLSEESAVLLVDVPPGFRVVDGTTASTSTARTMAAPGPLAKKLVLQRILHLLTREKLARRSGVPLAVLVAAETHGTPLAPEHIKALSREFGITGEELLQPPGTTAQEGVLLNILEEIPALFGNLDIPDA